MMRRKIGNDEGMSALSAVYAHMAGMDFLEPEHSVRLRAARFALEEIADRHPGHSVEIRVPYAGAVQACEGQRHRRGTPPNVVEADMDTFLALALGCTTWSEACAAGGVQASGVRAHIGGLFPLFTRAALERWHSGRDS